MFKLGESSLKVLRLAHSDFSIVAHYLMYHQIMDFAVRESYRTEESQNEAYDKELSKFLYPDSKHNKIPSDAVHFIPYVNGKPSYSKIDACRLNGHIEILANQLKLKLRCGWNWDMDEVVIEDQKFNDLNHWERINA